MESNILDQFFTLLKKRKISVVKASEMLDIPQDRIYQWKSKGTKPKGEDTVKLLNFIKTSDSDETPKTDDLETADQKSIRKPKIETNPELEGITYVPIGAQAGYSKHYFNPVFVKSLQKIYIPGMPYRGDKYRIFEVDGESMEPTLKHGYHVLGELVEKDSYAQVPNYYVYVIVTEDRVMLKRLYRKSDSEFVAISDNEEFFPQFGLHMGDIRELWLVKRKMDWEMAPPKKFEIHI
ncbi:S24 family peptidase [Danxiaibacter flavus]|uniref:S24 family peptidase n=1 Tax=Danxiaibacter flavus TaxID=3049108 RepID=A0ABV3ZMV2_9BACT|nr:S24 family peptidase [Chitinophagaceae bacterium DXS]